MGRLILLIGIGFVSFLDATEPKIMILDRIHNNGEYTFRYRQSLYVCKPYGVWTLDMVYTKQGMGKVCKKALKRFIISNPKLHNFAKYRLHREQSYHVERKKNGCVIFLAGKKTFSEELLSAGLAIKEPFFNDEECNVYFHHATQNAKLHRRGIWQDIRLQNCIAEFFKTR